VFDRAAYRATYEARAAEAGVVVDALAEEHERGGMALLGMPNIAIDKHTIRGATRGRGFEYFMQVGSLLANEAEEWHELSELFRMQIAE